TGALFLPFVSAVAARASGPGWSHVQSETVVTEEAARVLVSGTNPYGHLGGPGPLRAWPAATRSHFPYLPAMLLWGLPRAIGGDAAWSDARVAFAAGAVAAVLAALLLWPGRPGGRLRVVQVLAILPTGAAYLAGGGHDLPVL